MNTKTKYINSFDFVILDIIGILAIHMVEHALYLFIDNFTLPLKYINKNINMI